MPRWDLECPNCGHVEEYFVPKHEDIPKTPCTKCGKPNLKILIPKGVNFRIQFARNRGFYEPS